MTTIRRRNLLLAGGGAAALLTTGGAAALLPIGVRLPAASAHHRPPPDASTIVEWNHTLLRIVRTAGAQPATIHPTRSFAIMHAAIYDAVVAATGDGRPYSRRAGGRRCAPAGPGAGPGCCASTCPREPTCPYTPPKTSPATPEASTTGPANARIHDTIRATRRAPCAHRLNPPHEAAVET